MYSKQESAQLKQQFWTAFGQYMQPVLSAEGERINWINYKTGIRHIYFRMDVDKHSARIAVELKHPLPSERMDCLQQFISMKSLFESTVGVDWVWQKSYFEDDGNECSRIYDQLEGVSIFDRSSWPEVISFLKDRIIRMDEFWSAVKPAFEA